MNAPNTMAELQIEHLPLDSIKPSPTNPRKHFPKEYIEELGASIKAHGVIQPITVRPLSKASGTVKYEIVVGECRWRASKIAERGHIPALIRDIPDVAVLELQITENLQRNDLDPLEEADGYQALMRLKKINADQLAELIGKSRSYIYARTKLTDLCPEARASLQEGVLDASRALLIARIGHHNNQRQALKEIIKTDWQGEPMSYRRARDFIQQNYTLALKAAPFDTKDPDLVAKAGPCTTCPKRTGNQPDLFADIKGTDVCTDPMCFAEKRKAHWDARRVEAEAKGKTVIAGDEAKKIFASPYDHHSVGGGYLALDAVCFDDPKTRKVSAILGKNNEAVELAQNPHTGAIVEVVRSSAVTEALNEKGIKTHRQKVAQSTGKSRATGEKEKAERELRERVNAELLQLVHDKHPKVLGQRELGALASPLLDDIGNLEALATVLGAKNTVNSHQFVTSKLRELNGEKLVALVLDLLVLSHEDSYYHADKTWKLRGIAERYKIDVAAIEKRVKEELKTPKPEAKADAKPTPKKKAAKK